MACHAPREIRTPEIRVGGRYKRPYPWEWCVREVLAIHPLGLCTVRLYWLDGTPIGHWRRTEHCTIGTLQEMVPA